MVSHRSTKGASKARRDHINHEIRNMRALLPISRDEQERLSYLHSMSAICTFIRKSVLLRGLSAADRSSISLPYEAFLQSLHGFILVTTAQGRLVYVSENVSEYLGFSMLDVLQGDSLYDMVERADVEIVKSNLDTENNSSTERSFICCMQTSKSFKLQHGGCCSMLIRGSFRSFPPPHPSSLCPAASQPLFVALCTPTVDRLQSADSRFCLSFSSVHRADMTFTQLSHSVLYFLGYSAEELIGCSWYSLVHPEDLNLGADAHRSLLQADESSQAQMVLRLQSKNLSWIWIYIQANKLDESQGMSCTNFIISETEGRFLQKKVSCEAFKPSAPCHSAASPSLSRGDTKCFKRRRLSDSQSDEPSAKAGRDSERDICFSSRGDGSPAPSGDILALFTPPYSPSNSSSTSSASCSPLQQEELSCDLLMDGYTDEKLLSPECCFPEAAITCHPPTPAPPPAREHTFEPSSFISLPARSPLFSSSFDFCAADSHCLVPDTVSLSDLCDSSMDCALHQDDLCLIEPPQGGATLIQTQHVPHLVLPPHPALLTPSQSPSSSLESDVYSEREQVEISILAQQISSLASSFNSYHSLNPLPNVIQPAPDTSACNWPLHPPPLKHEQLLEDSMFNNILKDLDKVSAMSSHQLEEEQLLCASSTSSSSSSSSLSDELLPAQTFMDPFSLQLGRHDQNSELHQLNHYMQRVLQQDALAEENLY